MFMNKRIKLLIVLFAIMVGSYFVFAWHYINNTNHAVTENVKVCFNNYNNSCFNVEIADNKEEREKGLMFRENLPENNGMLFVFPQEDRYGFWMKNTLIPLDIIWFNENKKIVYIKENAQPCLNFNDDCESFIPDKEARYVLEVNAGAIERYGIKVGDEVRIKI